MNTDLAKQVNLIQSHHNYLFSQPLPRELRETTWKYDNDFIYVEASRSNKLFSYVTYTIVIGMCLFIFCI